MSTKNKVSVLGSNVLALAATAISVTFLTACGGGGGAGGGGPMSGGSPADITTHTPYSVSVNRGTFGSPPVSLTEGDEVLTIGGRALTEENITLLTDDDSGGYSYRHFRSFDAPGATSGPAFDLHHFGGYEHFTFGVWAEGEVSLNPGFRIGETFGAYFLPNSDRTPISDLPVTGSATWRGHYAGYVDREGVGVSQVAGAAAIVANFLSPSIYGSSGAITVELLPPDPSRSSFAAPPPDLCIITCVPTEYGDRVLISGPIDGNTFESDVTATRTLAGQTFPRGDTISVLNVETQSSLYSQGTASSGGMQGGFFSDRGSGSGGTYQFTIGTTKAVGSFGGVLQ